FKSSDRGLTWEDISGSLPQIHFNSIVYYKNSQEGLYLGSDAGVYYKDKSMDDWMPFNEGMPVSASVRELEIYYDPTSPAGDKIKAGTYGRGLWKSDMYYNMPVADFTASPLIIPPGCTVNFKDLSSGVPFQWSWNFAGATTSGSTAKNPTNIEYGVAGSYNVELTVTNPAGNNSTTKIAYITVSDTVKPIPGFYGNPQAYCNLTEIVKFVDTSKYCPYAWNWTFSPNTVIFENGTSAASESPEVLFTQPGAYSVTLAVANANGNRSVTKQNYINAGGFITPFSEDFESNSLSTKGWTIENPDNEMTWALTEVNGSSPGNKAVWMNFFNYPAPAGRRDRLISPVLNFTGSNPVFMSFYHAYASRYSTFSDSLIVYISEDCGISWERLLALGEKGQGTFATVPKQTTFFAPESSDQWCSGTYGSRCNLIDLTPWANKSNIQIAFESYNKYGNNLYLDNINISSTVSVKDFTGVTNTIQVYPNPTTGMVNVYSSQRIEDLLVSVFNAQGVQVYSKKVKPSSHLSETIDLGNLSKGVYLIKFSGNNTSEQQKLIIK
ncbi:MAG: PKD domain-containing protein, partial [Bacteroidales bacterium]